MIHIPYIKKEIREKFFGLLGIFTHRIDLNNLSAGELNYLITKIVDRQLGLNPNYARYNEIIGVLECVKLELYRRQVAKYEDKKWTENGDVYEKRN